MGMAESMSPIVMLFVGCVVGINDIQRVSEDASGASRTVSGALGFATRLKCEQHVGASHCSRMNE
jgi:hypothetical protein